jgi:hypothetical protein
LKVFAMSEAQSPWSAAPAPVRSLYPLQVRDHSLSTAMGLLMRSLPYAVARFGVQLAFSISVIVWMVVTFGGAAWLSDHVANAFAVVWLVVCLVGIGWFWGTVLRYTLHLIACGHVAVLTELIIHGRAGNGSESMFAYGKRVVTERFGQVTLLFGFSALVRGVINAFHNTLDWIADSLPIPGLESVAKIVDIVLRGATRYLDKVIFSYILARNDGDPGRDAREALVYYAQNAQPILKTSIWMVIQERVLSFLMFLLMLVPAGLITMVLPHSMRETGGIVTVVIAVMLASAIRSAFVAPLFLIVMMIRFHALVENQPIQAEWDARLAGISDKFRSLGQGMAI